MFIRSSQLLVAALILFGRVPAFFAQQNFEVQHFAGNPGGLGSRDDVGQAARFRYPSGIWGDETYLYVTDQSGNAIRRVTIRTAEVRLIAGSITLSGNQDGIGPAARFGFATGLWGDGTYLYIADTNNGRIRRLTLATGEVVTIAGQSPGERVDGPASQAVFQGPTAVWGGGRFLYVADRPIIRIRGPSISGALRRIDLVENIVTTISLASLTGVAADPAALWGDGVELFIAFRSPNALAAMDLVTNSFRIVVDPANAAAAYRTAGGMWSGGDGLVYLSDYEGSRILRINSTGAVTTIAGRPSIAADGVGDSARFNAPTGLWSDGAP